MRIDKLRELNKIQRKITELAAELQAANTELAVILTELEQDNFLPKAEEIVSNAWDVPSSYAANVTSVTHKQKQMILNLTSKDYFNSLMLERPNLTSHEASVLISELLKQKKSKKNEK